MTGPISTYATMCPMNCHPTLCGMLVDVQDGELVAVRGDKDNPDSQGFLCVRGQASRQIIGNPKRLLKPLVRDRRSEDAWREAGWDEVLDHIAGRIDAVGREATALWGGHGNLANNYGLSSGNQMLARFANLYGCPYWGAAMICWGLGGFGIGLTGALAVNTKEDMGANANFIVMWGANLASQPNTARHLLAAKQRGAKIVTIDVRKTETAAQSDDVLLIRPGSDAALALAVMQVIIGEELYDAAYGGGFTTIAAADRRPPGSYVPNQMSEMTAALADGRVRVLLLFGSNMLSSFAGSEDVAAALGKADLVVCHELFMNETTRRFADVVLPGTAWLEDIGCKATQTHLYLTDRILAPAGAARPTQDVLKGLAERLGIRDFYPWASQEELLDTVLDHPATGRTTVAALRANGGRMALKVSHVAYPDRRFDTPSGKIEFYSARAEAAGLPPLPTHGSRPSSDYQLTLCQGRTLTQFHAFYDHGQALPLLAERDPGPLLWISPQDAAKRRLAEGSTIRVHNGRGGFAAKAHVTDQIPAGIVWMRDGCIGLNRVTSGAPVVPEAALDLFHFTVGQAEYEAMVEVEAA